MRSIIPFIAGALLLTPVAALGQQATSYPFTNDPDTKGMNMQLAYPAPTAVDQGDGNDCGIICVASKLFSSSPKPDASSTPVIVPVTYPDPVGGPVPITVPATAHDPDAIASMVCRQGGAQAQRMGQDGDQFVYACVK
jgi:hypothetical protein